MSNVRIGIIRFMFFALVWPDYFLLNIVLVRATLLMRSFGLCIPTSIVFHYMNVLQVIYSSVYRPLDF